MGIVIPLAWLAVERLYLNAQKEQLIGAGAAGGGCTAIARFLRLTVLFHIHRLSNVLPGIHTRVIDPQGAVVIDLTAPEGSLKSSGLALPQLAQNAAGLVTPEELVSRPEIAQARLGQPATAIRRVDVAGGQRVLYAAAPVLSR